MEDLPNSSLLRRQYSWTTGDEPEELSLPYIGAGAGAGAGAAGETTPHQSRRYHFHQHHDPHHPATQQQQDESLFSLSPAQQHGFLHHPLPIYPYPQHQLLQMGTSFEETEARIGKDQKGEVSALRKVKNRVSQGRAVTFAPSPSSGAGKGDKGSRYPLEWAAGRAGSSATTQYGGNIDFELKTRRRSAEHPVDKLKKRASLFGQRRASSTAAPPSPSPTSPAKPPRHSSSSSSSASDFFRFFRFGSLSSSAKNKKRRGSTGGRAAVAASPLLDDLPSSRPALEGRINYHISRLDRLKVRLADLNTSIEQEAVEYQVCAADLERQGMGLSVLDLDRQLAGLRSARDGLKPSVAFHRGELDRIARKRLQMDREQGCEARLPGVYDTLDGDEAWEARFAP